MHRLTWVEPGRIDGLARDFFIHALIDMGACYILYDEAGQCICITSLPPRWTVSAGGTPNDDTLFGTEIALRLDTLRSGLAEPGAQSEIEIYPGDERIYSFRCRKIEIPHQGRYFIMAIADRTEERRRETLLQSLLLEVSHRSKNLLAIVQGIASQTARFTDSLDSFLTKFRGRLYALSQSQDLVTASSWRGAGFMDLLHGQISRYITDNPEAIEVSGENILLSPNAATHVGLALHELIVNAIAHGDILKHPGAVKVSCRRIDMPDGPQVKLEWIEHFSPPRTEPVGADDNFASTVLQRVVPVSVNGTASHVINENGVTYELVFPADMRN